MTSLPDLLARVEGATGADREIDGDLFVALECIANDGSVWKAQFSPYVCTAHGEPFPAVRGDAAEYTASLDQALALCDRVLPEAYRELVEYLDTQTNVRGWTAAIMGNHKTVEADGKTPALALLAATLRALIAQEDVKPFVCEGNGSSVAGSSRGFVAPTDEQHFAGKED